MTSAAGRRLGVVILAAMLTVVCRHAPHLWKLAPPSAASKPPQVFDLTWAAADENGLPLNPSWGSQSPNPDDLPPAGHDACYAQPQSCTGQPTLMDWAADPSLCRVGVDAHAAGPFAAHVDWTVATFSGIVRPTPPPISDDDDFNFIFLPTDDTGRLIPNGLTAYNDWVTGDQRHQYIELEISSREVSDRFALPWWHDFGIDSAAAVRPGDDAAADEARAEASRRIDATWLRNGAFPRAVVIGLFGVDCEHGCRSEVHPLYALAVETDPNPRANVWAMFVRNWGDGGSCSTLNHEFNAPSLAVRIPPPAGVVGARDITNVTFARSHDEIGRPQFTDDAAGAGVVAFFDLLPPARRSLEELTVTIDWHSGDRSQPPPASQVRLVAPVPAAPTAATPPQSESAYILQLVDRLPADARERARQQLVTALRRPAANKSRAVPGSELDRTIHPHGSVRGRQSFPNQTLTDVATARNVAVWSILCEATQGQLPPYRGEDISKICKQVKWRKP